MKNIISLGAGVQSSCLALMAARGDFQDLNGQTIVVDAAIFSDTQAEPKSVMDWLDYLELEIKKLPYAFPIYRVTVGSLEQDELRIRKSAKSGRLYLKSSIPAFSLSPNGKKGLMGRRCTSDYKIIPLQRKTKEIIGLKRASKKTGILTKMWIGITTDEAHRMKPSRVNYIENTWPLIDAGMTRQDCLDWMRKNNYPEPPRSACVFCPFHSDYEWNRLKTKEPEEFQRACQFEENLQKAALQQNTMLGVPYLHSSCKPISQIDFDVKEEKGYKQISMFGNECEGLCGV